VASYKPVNAALRVLDVLVAVNQQSGRASVGGIHHQTGIDKATIVRMLETLISAGFVVRDAEAPLYEVTSKTLMLSNSYQKHRELGRLLTAPLEAFRKRINWPSDVAFYEDGVMLVVSSTRQSGALSFNRAAGFRSPVFASSLGLAYMAHAPAEEVEEAARLAAMQAAPWNGLATDPVARAETLAEIRARGYAEMDPTYSQLEYQRQVTSIGVPVLAGGRSIASVNVIYLRRAMTPERAVAEVLPGLQAAAGEMAEVLQSELVGVS
jgi:IclR family mhp operon transcriptional activator